VYKLPYVIT